MKRLKVPIVRQKRKTGCGPAVLAGVFNYYGKKITQDDILKKIKLDHWGSYNADLGTAAIEYGFKAKIYSLDLELFHQQFGKFLNERPKVEELKKILKRLNKRKKREMEAIVNFIKAGGDYQIKIPEEKMLIEAIDKRIAPIISVNLTLFLGSSPHSRFGHYLIVSGYDKKDFWIIDTLEGKELKIKRNKLLVGWILNAMDSSGYILLIRK